MIYKRFNLNLFTGLQATLINDLQRCLLIFIFIWKTGFQPGILRFYIKKTDATAVEPIVSKTRPRTSDRGGYYFGTSEEDSARPQSEARRP